MRSLPRARWAAIAALSLSLVACGAPPPQAPAAPAVQEAQVATSRGTLMSSLELTATQAAQLRAIKARYRGIFPRAELRASLKQLKALLAAPEINQPAVEAAFEGMLASYRSRVPVIVMLIAEVRDVLTESQRQRLASKLTTGQSDVIAFTDTLRDQGFTLLAEGLDLTPEQEVGWLQLKVQDKTQDDARLAVILEALARFMGTGNTGSLQASLLSSLEEQGTEIETFVSFLATLSSSQRMKLIANTETYLRTLKAAHRAMHARMF